MNQAVANHSLGMNCSPSYEQSFPPVLRENTVTQVTPAKKITFLKSGDPQFAGVKMAINKRSFKSFNALVDDLSHKIPLPFGVRTITTPQGTHCINKLEQLEDGACYLCSDKKYVQPISPGAVGYRVEPQWNGHLTSAKRRDPLELQKEEYSVSRIHHAPRRSKRVTLIKNGDPTVRRSILLNQRNAHNLKALLDDVSELLQCTVKKFYTLDGRRIDSIQAVVYSPDVLVCVGQEPFKPILTENSRKSSTEKLPGMGLRSYGNTASDSIGNKKNVNLELKTKKSVIHPRSSSSSRMGFSFSSEKSSTNGVNMSLEKSSSFASACQEAKTGDMALFLTNDDIEKKVHVNKDGSLSVEMKVRFHLLNNETLQWSTQIEKGKCGQVCLCEKDDMKHLQRMDTEAFSEADDLFYPCDADSYNSRLNEEEFEDKYYQNCENQAYDIWKNPMDGSQKDNCDMKNARQTRSTGSNISSYRRVVSKQKTSMDSICTISSEAYTEHLSCYSETLENEKTRVQNSIINQYNSQRGLSRTVSNGDGVQETRVISLDENQRQPSSYMILDVNNQSLLDEQYFVKGLASDMIGFRNEAENFSDDTETFPTLCSKCETNDADGIKQGTLFSKSYVHSRKRKENLYTKKNVKTRGASSNLSCKQGEESNAFTRSRENGDPIIETHCEQVNHCSSGQSSHKMNDAERDKDKKCVLKLIKSQGILTAQCETCTTQRFFHCKDCSKKKEMKRKDIKCERIHLSEPSHSGNSSKRKCTQTKMFDDSEKEQSEMSLSHTRSEESKIIIKKQNRSKRLLKSHPSSSRQSESSSVSEATLPPLSNEYQWLPDIASEHQFLKCKIVSHCEDDAVTTTCPLSFSKSSLKNKDENASKNAESPLSRPPGKPESFSPKCKCSNLPGYGVLQNINSLNVDIKNKSIETVECHRSGNDVSEYSIMQFSQPCKKEDKQLENKEVSGTAYTYSKHCLPLPQENPRSKHAANMKCCFPSISSSDLVQNVDIQGEKHDFSRKSILGHKSFFISKVNPDTMDKIKMSGKNCSSKEENPNSKKRRNSGTSIEKKPNGASLEEDELIPSSLPNLSVKEVVHEWLRKIPSETMVVEYGEDDLKVGYEDVAKHLPLLENSRLPENETSSKLAVKGNNNCNLNLKETGFLLESITAGDNNNNPEHKVDHAKKGDYDISPERRNINQNQCMPASIAPLSRNRKNVLPKTVHTSVQIMKALFNPPQEAVFERSNSLLEISAAMWRKLSSSTTVLITCLANLQLLDENLLNPLDKPMDLNKPRYTELLNIFQALWLGGKDEKKRTISNKPTPVQPNIISELSNHYSGDDELTPVSSSGIDINSGSGGSGEESVAGIVDYLVISEKRHEYKSSLPVTNVTNNATSLNESNLTNSGDVDNERDQFHTSLTSSKVEEETGLENWLQAALPNTAIDEENENSNQQSKNVTNLNDFDKHMRKNKTGENEIQLNNTEAEQHDIFDLPAPEKDMEDNVKEAIHTTESSKRTENDEKYVSTDDEESDLNEFRLQDMVGINPKSTDQSAVHYISKSNEKNDPLIQKLFEEDPGWVSKLLKKIEKQFMTHYVDAMNEFKARWHLENNESLDEMIAELGHDVGKRIQQSVEKELKKIQKKVEKRIPRPLDEASMIGSAQLTERRQRHLQTMHKNSAFTGVIMAHSRQSEENNTYDEDLTFSASWEDVASRQEAGDDYCPCETCIRKIASKAVKCTANAPIVKAFDLQQILRMKKEKETKNESPSEMTREAVPSEHTNTVNETNPSNKDKPCGDCWERIRNMTE
ncbi:retinitis pigmentosa 1-like 1 protein [Microcaecilia unicolor]|uniref:Retinitis pigmentosa 1-like 1 protein n=1 Tax=Microcaecilia unicolor TaxID=1415580 RepID=A0A6P7XK33_9AMPH|nr:retinitis pigmentosa 1-like 1 protein [Microcaecilia unicolor]